ncbi:4-(cytidine 5'-diphospho)-2-C-methyl-D-erythritol kinase [soil metagenome]
MLAFPNCKINIGLHITGKRADGFHNIETIFVPVAWKDALEIIEDHSGTGVLYTQSGTNIPGDIDDNLCIKAYSLIKKDIPALPAVKIHLHKAIPMGAGLGGGSSDAAFALKLLNSKFDLQVPKEKLNSYALQLGSDCPFFLLNKPSYATGRGELLEEITLDLSSYKILLINPGIHINTGWAFSKIIPVEKNNNLKDLVAAPIETWQQHINNDFEKPVFHTKPEIANIKATLLANGALYAAMSGSGSTVFGIFKKNHQPPLNFPAHYFYKWV